MKSPNFDIELKTFNFLNYTYPVPIRKRKENIVYVFNNIINCFFLTVIHENDTYDYLINKKISYDKIEEGIKKLENPDGIKLKYFIDEYMKNYQDKNDISSIRYYYTQNYRTIIIDEITKFQYYYELTKKINIEKI